MEEVFGNVEQETAVRRAWRCCLLRSERVLRDSQAKRRRISFANLSRFFRRQWRCAVDRLGLRASIAGSFEALGVQVLRGAWAGR